jgi:hypothetical protein
MKPEQDDCLEDGRDLGKASDFSLKTYSDRKSSAKSRTRYWKQFAVYGGEGLIESAVALCSYCCRYSTASMGLNRPHPLTFSVRPIRSGWSGPFQR